jgi:hypothetical protein
VNLNIIGMKISRARVRVWVKVRVQVRAKNL